MENIITFDEYIERIYKPRLARAIELHKDKGRSQSESETRARGLSLEKYLSKINELVSLLGKNEPINPDYISQVVGYDVMTRIIPSKEIRHQNLTLVEVALSHFYVGDNYGILIFNERGNFFEEIDNLLRQETRGYEPKDIRKVSFGIGGFDKEGRERRANGIERDFYKPFVRDAPVFREIEGLHWNQITSEQSQEMRYLERLNSDAVICIRQLETYPDNQVVASLHGAQIGIAKAINFLADLVKKQKYFAHFYAEVKPSPYTAGILYDPRNLC